MELLGGSAYSFNSTLEIRQEGQPEISRSARWDTKPFSDSPYYAARLSLWSGSGAWELQLIHHKAYLSNTDAEIERFEVTHGYNLVTFNRAFTLGRFIGRAGLGFVVAHSESVVRGVFEKGHYVVTGPTGELGFQKRWNVLSRLSVSADVELTASRAEVPVAGGEASAPNFALHFRVGIGYRVFGPSN